MAEELRTGQFICVEGNEGTINLNRFNKSDFVELWDKLKPCGITLDDLVTMSFLPMLKKCIQRLIQSSL